MGNIWYLSRTLGGHDRTWVELLESSGHRVTVLAPGSDVAQLRDLGRAATPDGIVAGPLTDAFPTAVEAGVAPVLGLCWGFDLLLEMKDESVRARVVDALHRSAFVHVDCLSLQQEVIDLGVAPDRVSVAAWGIDLAHFVPASPSDTLRSGAGFGANDVVVLTTRALELPYAVDIMLEGFARARRVEPRLKLVWAGSGSQEARLVALSRELGITDTVHRVGQLDRRSLHAWLCSADIYASAARADGSSLSLLEALACGTSVVVTDLPSNREWVPEPAVGHLFTCGDPGRLAEALLAAAKDRGSPLKRRELVEARGDWSRNRVVVADVVHRMLESVR